MPSVLFVAPSAYTLSGLATWLDYLLPGLRQMGWDARLGLVSGPVHHRPQRYVAVHPAEHVAIAHCATGTSEGRFRALVRLLDQTRPDLAVAVNVPDLMVAVNRLRAARIAAPHVAMSVHGIEAFLYADAARYRHMLDAVICTNRLACALAGQLAGIAEANIRYAPYGVAVPPLAPAIGLGDCLRIVYSGRLESAQKRVVDLVGIIRGLHSRNTPFRLDIAGDGPERASLEQAFAAEIADGSVCFHGQLPMDELKNRIYASAHALLITSQWETGPIVAWEAMAQGLPVVSARYIGSGREGALRDNDNALLFDIGDTDAAATALNRLWCEPPLRQALCESARKLVLDRYDIPVSVGNWDEVLRAVLARPSCDAQILPAFKQAGRLDRWVGSWSAESLRALSPHRVVAPDAGGEWPHAHVKAVSDDAFWRVAESADKATETASPRTREIHVA